MKILSNTLTRRQAMAALTALPCLGGPNQAQTPSAAAPTATRDLRRSQLFLDDTWIEETHRLERIWEAAEIFPEPMLRPETAWEGYQIVISGSVLRIGDEWRMYYTTYKRPDPMRVCMVTSTDGMRWERPKLGRIEYAGNKANNIVYMPPGGQTFTAATICHDPGDAARPFKMMYYAAGGNYPTGEFVAFSRDGLEWQTHPGPVLTTTGDQTNLMATRDPSGKYLAFLRHKMMLQTHRARCIWRTESDDFLQWTEPELILEPDLFDGANTELYGMAGFPYSDMYLGLVERWKGNPDEFEIQLAWSHDSRRWHRPAVRKPFISARFPWNERWSSSVNTAPLRVGNSLRFYFGGRSRAHGRELGQVYGAVGMAVIGVDRFAAIHGDFKEGQLISRPMTWPGGELILNCNYTRYPDGFYNGGGGTIEVEVRDENNLPVEGYSEDQRAKHNKLTPFPWKEEEKPVEWPSKRLMNELAGRRIRLVFLLRDSRLYSFRARA
ncbi:MAG: hypothetical protein NTY38_13950 [Acidobacteria bacterium]|nr:hypothetical protein [Acidobacteriota bacterium]